MKKTLVVDPKKAAKVDDKSLSGFEFDDVFDKIYTVPSWKSHRIEGCESAKERLKSILTTILEKMDNIENRVGVFNESLGTLEQSCSDMKDSISTVKAAMDNI